MASALIQVIVSGFRFLFFFSFFSGSWKSILTSWTSATSEFSWTSGIFNFLGINIYMREKKLQYYQMEESKIQLIPERRPNLIETGRKSQPTKKDLKVLLEKMPLEDFRKLIKSDGTFGGLTAKEVQDMYQFKPKSPSLYTQMELVAVRDYYINDLLPKHKAGRKHPDLIDIQAKDLTKQVLSHQPSNAQRGQSDFVASQQAQIQMANELIKSYYGANPTEKQREEMFSRFGIHSEPRSWFSQGGQKKVITLADYKLDYDNNAFIENEEQLQEFHENILNMSQDDLLRQRLEQTYGRVLTGRTIQTSRLMYPTEEEVEKPHIIQTIETKHGKEAAAKMEARILEHQRKMLMLESGSDGTLSDATGQRSDVPVGIVEESKSESMRLKWPSESDLPKKGAPRPRKKKIQAASDDNVLADLKLAQKNVTRNGGQNGADLAVVENKEGVETYMVKYPTLDEMLNLSVTRQLEFDLAQRRHLNKAQIQLMQEVLSTGAIYKPNIEFLRDAYKHEPTEANLEKYNQAIISQIGREVAYFGGSPVQDEKTGKVTSTQQMAKIKPAKKGEFGAENIQDEVIVKEIKGQKSAFGKGASGKNVAAPALQADLSKPEMLSISEITKGIAKIVDYISKLSGNLDTPDLSKYEKVTDVFKGSVVHKEPTQFKPQPGQGFKVRQLEC